MNKRSQAAIRTANHVRGHVGHNDVGAKLKALRDREEKAARRKERGR